jgi:actin-related protein
MFTAGPLPFWLLYVQRVVKNGVVQDWEDFRVLLEHLFYEEMKLTPATLAEHPVMFVEPPMNPRANRDRLMQVLFDHFPVPAVFVANTATLGLYAVGAVSGVLVEVGHDVAFSVAVYEGNVLPATLRRLDVAGQALDLYLIRCVCVC